MRKLVIVTLSVFALLSEPTAAKPKNKKQKQKLDQTEQPKPSGIIVDQCKTWFNYINPHTPALTQEDKIGNIEFSRHFILKDCRHPNYIDEADKILQMTEREYKRALLPPQRHGVFKADDGETWQYWSLERCTEEQREKYYKLMEKISKADLRYRVWENDAIKYLVFDEWNVEDAYQRVLGKNEYLVKYRYPIRRDEVQKVIDTGMFRVQGFDKYGRGVAWIQTSKMLPNKHGVDLYMRFIIYTQELAQNYNRLQNFYKDKYVTQDAWVVVDQADMSLANLSIEFQTKLAVMMWSSYVLMTHKIFMINCNWALTMSYAVIKNFLPKNVTDMIYVYKVGDNSWQEELFKHVDKSQIPKEYGGDSGWENAMDLDRMENGF